SSFSTSHRTNSVLRPSSATIRWPPSSLTSAMTTLAPAACRLRAAASPSPEAPPVTIAPTPLSSMRWCLLEKFGPVQFAVGPSTGNAVRTHCTPTPRLQGEAMTATEGLRYIDSDGHILEHPTDMPQYAPAEWRDRVWHIETDADGVEYLHYNDFVMPSNGLSLA